MRTKYEIQWQFFHDIVMPYEGDDCLIWPFGKSGYRKITERGVRTYIHRLVCEKTFGPAPSPDHEAAHSCGRGGLGCVAKRHLRWATPSENQLDRSLHGTDNGGERNASAKLTAAQIQEIRALKGQVFQRDIAARFGVTQQQVSRIQSGKRWGVPVPEELWAQLKSAA
jgi:hypothetical protein